MYEMKYPKNNHVGHRCIYIWRFPKSWWYPQIIIFNGIFHFKKKNIQLLGYPHFRKPPYKLDTRHEVLRLCGAPYDQDILLYPPLTIHKSYHNSGPI